MNHNRYNLDSLRNRFRQSRNKLEFEFEYDSYAGWRTHINLNLVKDKDSKAIISYSNYKKYTSRPDHTLNTSSKELKLSKEVTNYLLENIYNMTYTNKINRAVKLKKIKEHVDVVIGNIITKELENMGLA